MNNIKIQILVFVLLFITKSILSQGIQNNRESNNNSIASDECININSWLKNNDTYNCCNEYGIICENNYITQIHIVNAQLTGSIPSDIGNLTHLRELWLNHNQLTGSIPPEIGKLTNLRDLSISTNQSTGLIPFQISKLENLEKLDLSNNQLSNNIPNGIEKLTELEELNLSKNQLIGEVPKQLENLKKLKYLYLGNNQLSGDIPSEIRDLPNLIEFSFNDQIIPNKRISEIKAYVIFTTPVVVSLPLLCYLIWYKIKMNKKSTLQDNESVNGLTNSNDSEIKTKFSFEKSCVGIFIKSIILIVAVIFIVLEIYEFIYKPFKFILIPVSIAVIYFYIAMIIMIKTVTIENFNI